MIIATIPLLWVRILLFALIAASKSLVKACPAKTSISGRIGRMKRNSLCAEKECKITYGVMIPSTANLVLRLVGSDSDAATMTLDT